MKRLQTQRLRGASAVLVIAGSIALAGAPGADAADDYLEFSPDGKTYGPTMPGPVFSESMTYIPGAGQAATVWVRNNSDDSARLSSAALMVRTDPELTGYLELAAGYGVSAAGRVELGATDSCMDLPGTWNLGSGEEIALTFAVDMSIDAPNATRNSDAEFDLLFYLESTDAGLPPRAACDVLDDGMENGGGTGGGADGSQPPAADAGVDAQGISPQAPSLANGALSVLPGSETSTEVPQAVTVGAVRERPAAQAPKGVESLGQEAVPQVLDAVVQSTVEPVTRSLSGTLLIAMSVVFAAAVVLRVWSRRYE